MGAHRFALDSPAVVVADILVAELARPASVQTSRAPPLRPGAHRYGLPATVLAIAFAERHSQQRVGERRVILHGSEFDARAPGTEVSLGEMRRLQPVAPRKPVAVLRNEHVAPALGCEAFGQCPRRSECRAAIARVGAVRLIGELPLRMSFPALPLGYRPAVVELGTDAALRVLVDFAAYTTAGTALSSVVLMMLHSSWARRRPAHVAPGEEGRAMKSSHAAAFRTKGAVSITCSLWHGCA
jgi:hypothetical protein